jgi:hypothetical protein
MRRNETLDLLLRRTPGRLFLCGALLLVTHPSFFKRCGCDKEEAVAPAGSPFRISGRAFNFEDQMPVSGVTLNFDGPETDYSATTDAEGRFTLAAVVGGTYDLTVTKDGFDERMKSVLIDRNTETFDIPLAAIHQTPLMIGDTWVSLESPTENFSEHPYFVIGRKERPGDESRSLLRIGVDQIPAGAEIMRATMTGWARDLEFDPDASHMLCEILTPWDPATVTWVTRPEIGTGSLGHVTHIDQVGPPWRIDWDITDVVTTYRDPGASHPIFGVSWTWDHVQSTAIGSSECDSPDCGGTLTGQVWWYREAPDFP